jgi:urease accessory protein
MPARHRSCPLLRHEAAIAHSCAFLRIPGLPGLPDNSPMNSRLPTVLPDLAANWHAELYLGFARAGERTVLRENRHRGPLRVQKALYPEGDAVCQAIVLHPPSGIAGGDHLVISATLGGGAHAQLTTPGAGKWYRSGGSEASQRIDFTVEAGATLEWLPQETIVFDGAQARMETRVKLAADSHFIGWDILCLGRAASGERFEKGEISLFFRVDRNNRPIWLERGHVAGNDPMLASPAGWAGHSVCGTLLCSFPELPQQAAALHEALRAIAPADAALHGITALPGVLIARYLGDNSEAARLWFADLWTILRPAYCGRPAILPRIWNT